MGCYVKRQKQDGPPHTDCEDGMNCRLERGEESPVLC